MLDLARLRGVIVAVGAVALALGCLSAVSLATAGGRPAWLSGGDSTIEGGQDAIVGGRIAGVVRQARSGHAPEIADLGVILGSSAVGMGIDPEIMEAEAGGRLPARWLSLYANGANLDDLAELAGMLFASGLQPKVLILGIHPVLLSRSDDYLSDRTHFDTGALKRELSGKHLLGAKSELMALSVVPIDMAFPNRTRISNRVRGLASAAKRRMFAALGMGADAMYAPPPDPWAVRLLIEDAADSPRMADAEGRKATVRDRTDGPMREGLAGAVKDKGWSGPANYSTEGANARSLVAIVREARSRGIEAVILLLPEATSLRASVPPEAMQTLHGALARGFGAEAPTVIDLRASLLDSQLHDSLHPMKAGREIVTRRLIGALRARPGARE